MYTYYKYCARSITVGVLNTSELSPDFLPRGFSASRVRAGIMMFDNQDPGQRTMVLPSPGLRLRVILNSTPSAPMGANTNLPI